MYIITQWILQNFQIPFLAQHNTQINNVINYIVIMTINRDLTLFPTTKLKTCKIC